MSRPLRIEYPRALYHLTSRGNAQADIFRDDADREEFLAVLAAVVERFEWRLYAYCLMQDDAGMGGLSRHTRVER